MSDPKEPQKEPEQEPPEEFPDSTEYEKRSKTDDDGVEFR